MLLVLALLSYFDISPCFFFVWHWSFAL